MIDKRMFFADPKIEDYRDIILDDVLKEYLLFKGTIDTDGSEINKRVYLPNIVGSALFIYNLKSNQTNKDAVKYYCEREARRRLILDGNMIMVPKDIWNECNRINEQYKSRIEVTIDTDAFSDRIQEILKG